MMGLHGPRDPWWNMQQFPAAPVLDTQRAMQNLDFVLHDLLNQSEPSEEERKVIQACLETLEALVLGLGDTWQIHAFGSAANGFSSTQSDLDVTCFQQGVGLQDSMSAIQELKTKLAPLIRQEPRLQIIEEVWNARIPILKLRFDTTLDVDLSCHNLDALQNTLFLKAYSNLHVCVKKLVLCVKHWAKREKICGSQKRHLSTYALTLMVIFFMQVHHNWMLPCLPTYSFGPDWVHDDIKQITWPIPSPVQLTRLLYDFFCFYASDFLWSEEVVSVRLGRRAFSREMDFVKLTGVMAPRLNIEDPFLLDRNLNCTLGLEQENQLKASIQSTFNALQNWQIPGVFLPRELGSLALKRPLEPPPLMAPELPGFWNGNPLTFANGNGAKGKVTIASASEKKNLTRQSRKQVMDKPVPDGRFERGYVTPDGRLFIRPDAPKETMVPKPQFLR